jgi:acyl-CoA hydrolase
MPGAPGEPRHDIVVTEYGIADLRGKTDAQVIRSLLCISASLKQLLERAQRAGKLPGFQLPPRFAITSLGISGCVTAQAYRAVR